MSRQKKKKNPKVPADAVEGRTMPVTDSSPAEDFPASDAATTAPTEDPASIMAAAPEAQAPAGVPEPEVTGACAPVEAEAAPLPSLPPVSPPEKGVPTGTLGQRLRQAREARGWSVEEVGSRLHIPAQIIHTLEADQFDRIGHGIYLRGYLNNYARLVGVPTVLVESVVRDRDLPPPPLVASGTISHSRYLYQRYSVSALYLILTGVIVVPAVLLAMRAGMQPTVTELSVPETPAATVLAPQDASPAADAAKGEPRSSTSAPAPAHDAPPAEGSDAPLVASLAPFSALGRRDSAPHAEASAAVPAGAHSITLTLSEKSWVEVVSTSGEKLEYGLLAGGTTRTYTSAGGLDIRLGNSNGASVTIDGKTQDLAPFRRANVAHFRVSRDGEAAPHTDG